MQDGRGSLPRRSSGSLAVEGSQHSHDLPGTLRTNPLLYPGPVSPERRKLLFHFIGGTPLCPENQPRGPFTPRGAAITSPWLPFSLVPLPPKLVFETWWHEGPQRRVAMHVTFDTATRRCTAGTHVSLDMEVTTPAGTAINEYDLYVGAEVRVAGRRVTLRKSLTLATQCWLDQQARALLIAKYRLEEELNKFRPVVQVPAQYTDPRRPETLDFGSHQHMPSGGRISLRALYDTVLQLSEQLRQHRGRLPPLPDLVSERVSTAIAMSPLVPQDWSPERREAERREAEARRREALASAGPSDDAEWRNDLTHWLDSIPLASSCCTRYVATAHKTSLSADSGNIGKGDMEHYRSGGGGGHRSGGVMRPSAGSGTIPSAATATGGGSGSGSTPTLAFNLSVINKLAVMAATGGASGAPAGPSVGLASGVASVGAASGGPITSGAGAGGGSLPNGRVQSPAAAVRSPVPGSGGPTTPRPSAAGPVAVSAAAARQR